MEQAGGIDSYEQGQGDHLLEGSVPQKDPWYKTWKAEKGLIHQ